MEAFVVLGVSRTPTGASRRLWPAQARPKPAAIVQGNGRRCVRSDSHATLQMTWHCPRLAGVPRWWAEFQPRVWVPFSRSGHFAPASRPKSSLHRDIDDLRLHTCERAGYGSMLSVIPQSLSSIVMSFPTRSRISVPPIAIIVGSYGVKCTAQRSRSYCGVTPRSLRGVSS